LGKTNKNPAAYSTFEPASLDRTCPKKKNPEVQYIRRDAKVLYLQASFAF
jgi:hypothetical protein